MVHRELHVMGVVQGVGFRPFVYRLATEFGLRGAVWNDGSGVLIRIRGELSIVEKFTEEFLARCPIGARVDDVRVVELVDAAYDRFEILVSRVSSQNGFTHVSADLAMCPDCRNEFHNPHDRRFGYPFINCTQCGPRFTITRALPYDRPLTTMQPFHMCDDCRREYESPVDRRFHAQPNACPACGPVVEFMVVGDGKWRTRTKHEEAIHNAADFLGDGGILLLQGLGGYHLVCDATNEHAVRRLRRRKQREVKPLAVMFPDAETLHEWCHVSDLELDCLSSARAPIVLVERRVECAVAPSVAPDSPHLGVMLPYSPLHAALLSHFDRPVVMTSANKSEQPICYEQDDALREMKATADAALIHDRAIHMFADDSVVRVLGNMPRVFRRSRGYVPESVELHEAFRRTTLGFGGELKNTFALGKESSAILSQHLGDMQGESCVLASKKAISHFLNIFDARPELVACDLHPDYVTTRMAEKWSKQHGVPLVRVQHHHAHLAATLAEHHCRDRALCIALDGTGYGTDGTVWGGELLFGNFESFDRLGHLAAVPMQGNDSAAKQPWRMALSWLNATYSDELSSLDLPLLRAIETEYGRTAIPALLSPVMRSKFVPTTSVGRLFDAIAALCGFGLAAQYEGQAAMQLEGIMSSAPLPPYSFDIFESDGHVVLSPIPMIHEVVDDLLARVATSVISRRFHETMAQGFSDLALRGVETTGNTTVALGGGCFQNAFLLERITSLLTLQSDRAFLANVPANDGGLALGQICVANAQTL
ncbi:MAG: carbamoyltransferase HypF [bacterium]|nr:carbamoyltransferase HypF [bacterium]